jgi:hypothetical protein
VRQSPKHFQRLLDQSVGFLALDITQKTDTAGVMLIFGMIQTLLFGK